MISDSEKTPFFIKLNEWIEDTCQLYRSQTSHELFARALAELTRAKKRLNEFETQMISTKSVVEEFVFYEIAWLRTEVLSEDETLARHNSVKFHRELPAKDGAVFFRLNTEFGPVNAPPFRYTSSSASLNIDSQRHLDGLKAGDEFGVDDTDPRDESGNRRVKLYRIKAIS